MTNLIDKYLEQFHQSRIVDVNENYVLTILLASNETKYIQLDGQWRVFQRNTLCFSNLDLNNLAELRRLMTVSNITKLSLNEVHDLAIHFENHTSIQLLVSSTKYENWSINQEIICLPSGELTHFL
jgi:hypothetical protein